MTKLGLFRVSKNGINDDWKIVAISSDDAIDFFLDHSEFIGQVDVERLTDVSLSDIYIDEYDIDFVGNLKEQYGSVNMTEKACAYIELNK